MMRRRNLDLLITVAGGYMDAYSYLARGRVFATGQTGNFVLLGAQAVHRKIEEKQAA